MRENKGNQKRKNTTREKFACPSDLATRLISRKERGWERKKYKTIEKFQEKRGVREKKERGNEERYGNLPDIYQLTPNCK